MACTLERICGDNRGVGIPTTGVDLEFQVSSTAITLILTINVGNFADLLIIESSLNKAASVSTLRAHTSISDPILLKFFRPSVVSYSLRELNLVRSTMRRNCHESLPWFQR